MRSHLFFEGKSHPMNALNITHGLSDNVRELETQSPYRKLGAFRSKRSSLYFKPVLVCLFVVSNACTANHMTGSGESQANHPDMMWN